MPGIPEVNRLFWQAVLAFLVLPGTVAFVMLAFHLRVVFGEEPWLARTHGEKWTRYKDQVPRWFRFHSRVRSW